MTKKYVITHILLILSFLTGAVSHAENAQGRVLRILNWSEYIGIDDHISDTAPITERSPTLSGFMEKYGCNIEYYEYEDTAEAMISVTNLPGFYDILVITAADLEKYVSAGLLSPLSKEKIPNLINLAPRYRQLRDDPEGEYCVPYLAGTTGLAYRKDLVGQSVERWRELFEPAPRLKGKIGIFSDEFLVFPLALLSIGADPNEKDPRVLKKAGRLIYELKKNGGLGLVSSDVKEINKRLLNGELAMAIQYSGDALAAMDECQEGLIEYVIPKEGGEFYVDAFVIAKDAPNRHLAHAFIDFVLSPEIHAANAMDLHYMCPNEKSLAIIKQKAPEQLNNPAIYPPKRVMDKLKQFSSNAQEMQRLWRKIFK